MRFAPALAGAAFLFGTMLAVAPSGAAPVVPPAAKTSGLIVNVADWDGPRDDYGWRHRGWRHRNWEHSRWRRCSRWREICADRWDWGSWRYGRCLSRHGC